LAVPAFVVGLVVALFVCKFTIVTVEYKITVGEILTVVVTLVVVAMAADLLTRRAADTRIEKDILLDDVMAFNAAVIVVSAFCRGSRKKADLDAAGRNEVLNLLRDAAGALEILEGNLKLCEGTVGTVDLGLLKTAFRDYKSALTGGVFPNQPLDDDTYLESERKLGKLKAAISSVRFEVNRR